ncbi:MAG: pyridoxal-phosphate dependent enzyme [Deltaproteobacteria bacterium]|jgi:threonine synthase|nr:pyridoxal-phosphate dependent enzyme [Deltaproteobacteria bacterium]
MNAYDPDVFPAYRGRMEYACLACGARYPGDDLLYACPDCGGVFLLEDRTIGRLAAMGDGGHWRKVFDARSGSRRNALRGVFRYYELMAPTLEEEDILFLGEGHTPIVDAAPALARRLRLRFAFKNDGQNPSASFKDRGMVCAYSVLRAMIRTHGWSEVLAVCASTGDTSAAAALYGAYVGEPIKTAVLLPLGKVTPQQLAQPLGSGAVVLEVPGVFDECMKVVEYLAEHYRVALLNSKNSWRIAGQESYAYETAQWFAWELGGFSLFVPVGNAGNITAVMSGLLKLRDLEVIRELPRLVGVQSEHADPVWRYYSQPEPERRFEAVEVRSSVAQAAMIGDPVSFPRVRTLAERYTQAGGDFQVVRVSEQAIMDATILANRHGHIACTQGGECLAGLLRARELGLVGPKDMAVLDATAHILKFADFQDMYFRDAFPADYAIKPDPALGNAPHLLLDAEHKARLAPDAVTRTLAEAVADRLALRGGRGSNKVGNS